MSRWCSRLRRLSWVAAIGILASCRSETHSYTPSYDGARRVDVASIHFDDGDTFSIDGTAIRVLGIDTPEIAHPEQGILEGQPFGEAAAESTKAWTLRADLVEYVPGGKGYYGRLLAHVFVDGELLAVRLIRHGLAYETVTYYGDNGFPDLAQQILDAALAAPTPEFEEPYKWKRKQREKRKRAAAQTETP